MTSKFQGRDYSTLRSEIINFLRQRLPKDWDYTNLADPVVIFAESLARVGDQLHFTIDELRRECDIATANRTSSVYSYAMREGYKLMLPKGASGTITINSSDAQSDMLHLSISRFDEIPVLTTGDKLYAANDIDADLHKIPSESYIDSISGLNPGDAGYKSYVEYMNNMYKQTQRLKVVLGTHDTYRFSYGDINNDATVTLPDPLIDRNLIRLLVKAPGNNSTKTEWKYVDDIIAAGFVGNIYTLTTKFIGGVTILCIEFATNYRDLFQVGTTFEFDYIKIKNSRIENTTDNNAAINLSKYITINGNYANDSDIINNGIKYIVNIGAGIKGYTEFEDPNITKMNYKKYLQSYAALLTKDDFTNYIKTVTSAHCMVYDHSDNYKDGVLPDNTSLMERTIYILTEALYDERESLWRDITERTSRSDCIVLMPYGKDPYTIVVKAECFLLGTSVSDIATKIKSALLSYYTTDLGETFPSRSMIDHIVHSASDKVVYTHSLTVRDSEFGKINSDFNDVATLSNDDIDKLFASIEKNNIYTEMGKRYLMGIYTKPSYRNYPTEFPEYTIESDYPSKFGDCPDDKNTFDGSGQTEFLTYLDYLRAKYFTFLQYIAPKLVEILGSINEEIDGVVYDFTGYTFSDLENMILYYNLPVGVIDRVFNDQENFNGNYNPSDVDSEHQADPAWGNDNYKDYCLDYIKYAHVYYDKYPNVEYKQFPNAFPEIYRVSADDETRIDAYSDLITTQSVYGSIDSRAFDKADTEIIIIPDKWNSSSFIQTDVETKDIDPYYIKHHYMVSKLNRVVVLIKAIGN